VCLSQSTNWIFRISNPRDERLPEQWQQRHGVRYCVWQRETGEGGLDHLQGYLMLNVKKTLSFMKSVDQSAHWEIRKGSHEQARDYASKAETRTAGPWTYGEGPAPGKRNDLVALQEMLDQGMYFVDNHCSNAMSGILLVPGGG
jgi:hypothetical protein